MLRAFVCWVRVWNRRKRFTAILAHDHLTAETPSYRGRRMNVLTVRTCPGLASVAHGYTAFILETKKLTRGFKSDD
jgi:hypothetical protein